MTEEVVAPLDAYATAKPDEPTFTLQGGDPLAGPLVRLWAILARVRAGILTPNQLAPILVEMQDDARAHSVANDERERENLLLRATAAEQVSWTMDTYRKGGHATDKPTEAEDTHLTELQRIDLHDLRVRAAQKLSNFRCEIGEIREALHKAGYDAVDDGFSNILVMDDLVEVADKLKQLNEAIEPRRIFRKD